MEDKSTISEADIDKKVKAIASALGKNPKEVVTNYTRDTQEFIRCKASGTSKLTPKILSPAQLASLRALDHQNRVIAEAPLEEVEDRGERDMADKKSEEVAHPEGQITLKFPHDTKTRPAMSIDQIQALADKKVFPGPMSMDQIAMCLWQLSIYATKCYRNCHAIKEQAKADVIKFKEDLAAQARFIQSKDDEIDKLTKYVIDLETGLEKLDKECTKLKDRVKELSVSVKEATDEESRAKLLTKLSNVHTSVLHKNWINMDRQTGMSDCSYPIFHEEGRFKNPYKSCVTEVDIQDVNATLPGVYPYMTIMTMVLTVLPDSVKPAFIKELASARDALEFFLCLNAIARMSPIINHCIKAIRDSREKNDMRELEAAMRKVGDQLSLSHCTMVSFLDQSETSRNDLVSVSKLIQQFVEKFPGAATAARDKGLKAPNAIQKILCVGSLMFALRGESPRSAVLVRDAECKDVESETAILSGLNPILPAIFSLVRDKFHNEACSLIEHTMSKSFPGQGFKATISNWPTGF